MPAWPLPWGVLGYILLRLNWPIVNLVMGVVLGEIMENRLRETLSLGNGSLDILFQRPICIFLILLTLAVIILPLIMDAKKRKKTNINIYGVTNELSNHIPHRYDPVRP